METSAVKTDVTTGIKEQQTKWWNDVERIGDQRIPAILFRYNPAGKQDPGRSQKRRKEQF